MKNFKYITLGIVTIALASCTKTEFDDFEAISSGSANFAKFVSVGNSLTQGYQDNGVHNEFGQQSNSYPSIIAKQMGVNFIQPLVKSPDGSGYMKLISLEPEFENVPQVTGWNNWDQNISYNNLGIAGIRLTDCVPTSGDPLSPIVNQVIMGNNPYGAFMDFGQPFTSPPVSYLDYIKASNATFFTCWLGNNDVLGWATSGGDDGAQTIPGFGTIKLSELTPVTVFRNKYDSVLTAFAQKGAKGVCATLPDVTAIPFFTTVTLEAIGADVWITEGPYSNNPGNVRKATNEDLLLLTTKEALNPPNGHGFVQTNPLTHQEVLDKEEVTYVQNHTNLLNNEIKTLASSKGMGVVDMYAYMYELKAGITFDGVSYTANFIEGGGFSLDGVHPNTRGYAIIANKFIETINNTYGSNLRPVPVQDYPGIIFP